MNEQDEANSFDNKIGLLRSNTNKSTNSENQSIVTNDINFAKANNAN